MSKFSADEKVRWGNRYGKIISIFKDDIIVQIIFGKYCVSHVLYEENLSKILNCPEHLKIVMFNNEI